MWNSRNQTIFGFAMTQEDMASLQDVYQSESTNIIYHAISFDKLFNMVNPCSHLKLEQSKILSLVELVLVRRQLRTCMHVNVHGGLQEQHRWYPN